MLPKIIGVTRIAMFWWVALFSAPLLASRTISVPFAPAASNFNQPGSYNNVPGCELTNTSNMSQTISIKSLKGALTRNGKSSSEGEINDPPLMPLSNIVLGPQESYTLQYTNRFPLQPP